ncbi:Protein kinase domain [Macleaya cordata]|uniref:Protein kinase domain n=1 Tax=Macleaya cordata TaxID=56857 RepID=A0A200PU56_MACCD|nr:Protein kinase domain [Macleaya cordata]
MGCSQDSCYIDSKETLKVQNSAKNQPICSSVITGTNYHEMDFEVVSLLQKMVWELGLGCVLPGGKIRRQKSEKKLDQEDNEEISEHNKAWLLAESGGVNDEFTNCDPQSVHSSFRFSFGSQIELDSLCLNSSSSVATVLMVNLDTGSKESQSNKDLKWRRMESLERSISPVADTLVRFSYSEIRSATQNFHKGRVLGRGALSCVFRGRVGFRRTSVAIKRLDKEDKECAKAFCRELMIASSLQNRYIVPLVGFCIDPEEGLFLVYKYVSGGSLEHHLHEKKRGIRGRSSLPWSTRFKIAIGIAEAVTYLHNGTDKCVVHRDIKPSNILLSSNKTPKLCDFGLATWTPAPSVPFLCKTVKGTFGYLAPEYFQHGKVSDKTDVYAFGVVLLELITGRKPIEAKRAPRDENLVLWAKPLLQQGSGAFKQLLDPKLKLRPHHSRQMTRMVEAAAACINCDESSRPSIDQVIAILRGEENYSSNRSESPDLSGCVSDCYPQLHDSQTKSDMRSHLALAMLGVSDLEDDDHLYCR